ncbi:MAG: citryl-CoA lyase [Candidatus Magasanikbacteria bacterium CG10_big_fil_rev_8_21_14_0_10_40_10]|uniref:citrate synthase (unknown stereospecificity) n=1 Tax=Candidatus Magasanikbacteria bacterium CG10_big_fil_rev_8_21_14_0_10_40_10 TaxID=1974648 RepID=A0A2M6W4J3_9BACT|nr:MAG: citryl-CoA lyase [Candidatus Magasanikbacteria bacterium CG10_big_fil_rev_8_21_14_0_10_40_10]
MQWKTSISHISDGEELIRGYDLKELISKKSFAETIYLVLKGQLPDANQTKMINALFTAAIDHGIGVSSAMTARLVVSTGNSLHTALAAGILALGKLHGSAIEDAAKFFQENSNATDVAELVKDLKSRKIRLAGYGHKILKDDPRSQALFEVARQTGVFGRHCQFALKIHEELNKISSKKLPINVDGAMAAVMSDMGFDWKMAKGFFIIGRVPGLVAHVYEEMTSQNGLRRLSQDEVEYTGEPKRELE